MRLHYRPDPLLTMRMRQLMTTSIHDQIDRVIENPAFDPAFWGIRVETADGQTLYDHNGGKGLIPASCMKIISTGAALEFLGADHQFTTKLAGRGLFEGATWKGDLLICGDGDPSFGSPALPGGLNGALNRMTELVRAAGIKSIDGDVIGLSGDYPPEHYSPAWEYGDLCTNEGTATAGLALHENGFRFRITPGAHEGAPAELEIQPKTDFIAIDNRMVTGPVGCRRTAGVAHRSPEGNNILFAGRIALDSEPHSDFCHVVDGPAFAATLLHEHLGRNGIGVTGGAMGWPGKPGADCEVFGAIKSPPLSQLVICTNKPSNNFYADMLLRKVGDVCGDDATFAGGEGVIRRWLAEIGVPDLEVFQMFDGSGLARRDTVEPQQLCHVLRYLYGRDYGSVFYQSLPIAGVDPDLFHRMTEPPLQGNVHAKTGLIQNARAFSGYVNNSRGELLVFSIICNGYTIPWPEVDRYIDEICSILAHS